MNAPKHMNLFVKAWIVALAKRLASDPLLCKEKRLEKFTRHKDIQSVRYVRTLYNERFDMNHPNETFASYKRGARYPRDGMKKTVAAAYPDVDSILEHGLPGSDLLYSMLPGSPHFAEQWIKRASEYLSVFDLGECRLLARLFSGEIASEYYSERAFLFYESPAKYTLPKRILPIIIVRQPESALNVLAMAVSLHMLDRNLDGEQHYGKNGDADIYELVEFVDTRPFISLHVPLVMEILEQEAVIEALKEWNIGPADILQNCHIPEISPEYLQELDTKFAPMSDRDYEDFLQKLSWIQSKEVLNAC